MGVSEVLLCPYRCLEYKMERLENLHTTRTSTFQLTEVQLMSLFTNLVCKL